MNRDEQVAETYLRRFFSDVEFEPRGPSTAPDFLCDSRVAVEVRRISDLTTLAGKEVESQTAHMKLIPIIIDILNRISSDDTLCARSNYSVWVRIVADRQASKQSLLARLRKQLPKCLIEDHEGDGFEIEVTAGVTFAFRPASYGAQTFNLMGLTDINTGGFVAGSYVRSINRAVAGKSSKQIKYRRLYAEHWLLLVDRIMDLHIDSREDDSELDIVRHELTRPELWDRIIVINSRDLSTLLDY